MENKSSQKTVSENRSEVVRKKRSLDILRVSVAQSKLIIRLRNCVWWPTFLNTKVLI